MPAGTDIITYAPRVGSSGDDRYTLPSESRINYGDNSGFSSPPTISQINASSGINQIIGEINLRTYVYNSGVGSAETLSYVAANAKITSAKIKAIADEIVSLNDVDKAALNPSSAFTNYDDWAAANSEIRIDANDIYEMRKNLARDHFAIRIYESDYPTKFVFPGTRTGLTLTRIGTYYPTATPVWMYTPSDNSGNRGMLSVGQYDDPSSEVFRLALLYKMPPTGLGISTLDDAKVRLFYDNANVGNDFTLRLYRTNSYQSPSEPASAGDWGNLDNLESSQAVSGLTENTWFDMDVAHAPLTLPDKFSYWLVSDKDVLQTSPSDTDVVGFGLPVLRLFIA